MVNNLFRVTIANEFLAACIATTDEFSTSFQPANGLLLIFANFNDHTALPTISSSANFNSKMPPGGGRMTPRLVNVWMSW